MQEDSKEVRQVARALGRVLARQGAMYAVAAAIAGHAYTSYTQPTGGGAESDSAVTQLRTETRQAIEDLRKAQVGLDLWTKVTDKQLAEMKAANDATRDTARRVEESSNNTEDAVTRLVNEVTLLRAWSASHTEQIQDHELRIRDLEAKN